MSEHEREAGADARVRPAAAPATRGRSGAVHDLGYKRYLGSRRALATRWRVIVRNQVAFAWQGFWRYKSWLGGAVATTLVSAALLYLASHQVIKQITRDGLDLTVAAEIVPRAFEWYARAAFIVTLTVASSVVAIDLKLGAFTFYFSRPVRPIDYVLGKLGGVLLLMGFLLIAGPLALTLLNLGLSENTDDLIDNLRLVPKALLVGAVATVAYAAIPLGVSALSTNRRHTVAIWGTFYFLIGNMALLVAKASDNPTLAALDVPTAVSSLAMQVFDAHVLSFGRPPSVTASIVSLLAMSAAGIAVMWARVRSHEGTGVGGG